MQFFCCALINDAGRCACIQNKIFPRVVGGGADRGSRREGAAVRVFMRIARWRCKHLFVIGDVDMRLSVAYMPKEKIDFAP